MRQLDDSTKRDVIQLFRYFVFVLCLFILSLSSVRNSFFVSSLFLTTLSVCGRTRGTLISRPRFPLLYTVLWLV